MLLTSPSRLARSLLAAALLLVAPASLAAAPPRGAAAASGKAGAEKKADSKPGARSAKTAAEERHHAAKADKKSGAKPDKADKQDKKSDAKPDKKSDAKPDKKADKQDKADKKADKADKGSIGAPNKGRLVGGIKLRSSRGLKVRDRAQSYGLPELVKLLQRAAGKVAKKFPKSVLLVGDLSRKMGGAMVGHNSHQSGRDADVGLYVANSKGKPAAMTRFVAFDGDGKSAQVSWAQFDDARNWALVEALVTDTVAPVRYIFVSNPLRARLLAYAKKKKVDKDVYTKAAFTMLSPRDADVHDDHFHVRITCPDSMKATCIEESLGHPAPPVVAAAKPTNAKPTDANHADAKHADANHADANQPDSKQADSKQAGVKQAGVKQAGVQQPDSTQTGVKQADSKQTGVKQADAAGANP